MLSEQFALSGQDKVSGRTAGSLAVDEGAPSPITLIYNWKPKVVK